MIENRLREEFERCFMGWCGDFRVDLEEDGDGYFECSITNKRFDTPVFLRARVNGYRCEIDMGDDDWEELSKSSVFAYMYFDLQVRLDLYLYLEKNRILQNGLDKNRRYNQLITSLLVDKSLVFWYVILFVLGVSFFTFLCWWLPSFFGG